MIIQEKSVDGISYTLYLDSPETEECGFLKYNEGCTIIPIGGKPRVYISSAAPTWVFNHEVEHVRGMRHSDWKITRNGYCCIVYWTGTSQKYSTGDIICNDGWTEYIVRKWGH